MTYRLTQDNRNQIKEIEITEIQQLALLGVVL